MRALACAVAAAGLLHGFAFAAPADSAALAAARSSLPYYRVDTSQPALVLSLQGVELRRYAADAIAVGRRYASARSDAATTPTLVECARSPVEPARETPTEGRVPLAEEEPLDSAEPFQATCGPGLSLRFVSSARWAWWRWAEERWASAEDPPGAVRLRFELPPEEHAALERGMPAKFYFILPALD